MCIIYSPVAEEIELTIVRIIIDSRLTKWSDVRLQLRGGQNQNQRDAIYWLGGSIIEMDHSVGSFALRCERTLSLFQASVFLCENYPAKP